MDKQPDFYRTKDKSVLFVNVEVKGVKYLELSYEAIKLRDGRFYVYLGEDLIARNLHTIEDAEKEIKKHYDEIKSEFKKVLGL